MKRLLLAVLVGVWLGMAYEQHQNQSGKRLGDEVETWLRLVTPVG